jgi:uncharacterized protein (TIGR00159 family)
VNWPIKILGLNIDWAIISSWLMRGIDLSLVVALIFGILLAIGDRRTFWLVRGLVVLIIAAALSQKFKLIWLSFALEKLVIGSALAMSIIFQAEFRRFLEQLGRGDLGYMFRSIRRTNYEANTTIDNIVDAVKDLSQKRIGALLIMETSSPFDDRDFSAPGVRIDAQVSKELLQTIFQPTTLLHDGAVLIRGDRVVAAGVILPLSAQTVSAQLGTRHRAAMGITERFANCLCVVVSEETGSISLSEKGLLNRPLTSSKLKELLELQFAPAIEQKTRATGWRRFLRASWRRRFFGIILKSKNKK